MATIAEHEAARAAEPALAFARERAAP